MKTILSLSRHQYVARASIILITAALIAGMVGCVKSYTITISSTAGGSVTIPGESGPYIYDEGTVVNLVATPHACCHFVNWTGDVGTIADVDDATTTITMKGDYAITANFEGEAVTFPDPNLEAAIRQAIGKPTGPIYPSDLEGLTSIYRPLSGITDLKGLECCTSLTGLDLGWNQISDISPLANLTSLTELGLDSNQISDISPLANLTHLTSLHLDSNQISDISLLANLTSLTELFFGGNQIDDISPVANLTSLARLYLEFNQIDDISPVANLTSLTWLSLSSNQISDISALANLTSLTELFLRGNQIDDISPVANLTSLTWLWLDSNHISDISPLANLTSLIWLSLDSNQISDISPLVDNEGLSEGDQVDLTLNPLSSHSINIYIPQLEARGVIVDY